LVIEDDEVVYQRMSGDDLPPEVFVPKYFRFHAECKSHACHPLPS